MTKEEQISHIENTIESEFNNHPELNWAGIAARKIYSELIENKP